MPEMLVSPSPAMARSRIVMTRCRRRAESACRPASIGPVFLVDAAGWFLAVTGVPSLPGCRAAWADGRHAEADGAVPAQDGNRLVEAGLLRGSEFCEVAFDPV